MKTKAIPTHGNLTVEQLKELPMTELIALYNATQPEDKRVKVFHSKTVGAERVAEVYPDTEEPISPTPVMAEGTTTEEVKAEDNTATNTEETDMAKKTAKKTRSSKKYDLDAKIKVLVDENPKRKGTDSAKRFAKYENGMKIGTALEKGVTLADIDWDVKHNYIKLS